MFKELKVSFQATSATRIARWPQPLTKLFSNDEFVKKYAFEGTYDAFGYNALQNEIGE